MVNKIVNTRLNVRIKSPMKYVRVGGFLSLSDSKMDSRLTQQYSSLKGMG
jgi:hypothetical protein